MEPWRQHTVCNQMWQSWFETLKDVAQHLEHVVSYLAKLVSMQIVNIQCRPVIYSTYVQRLSVHTYIPMYSAILSLPLSRWTTTWVIHSVPQNGIQLSPSHPFCRKSIKNLSVKLFLLSVVSFFHHAERMAGGEYWWEERRAQKWMWVSSRKPSWILPWP